MPIYQANRAIIGTIPDEAMQPPPTLSGLVDEFEPQLKDIMKHSFKNIMQLGARSFVIHVAKDSDVPLYIKRGLSYHGHKLHLKEAKNTTTVTLERVPFGLSIQSIVDTLRVYGHVSECLHQLYRGYGISKVVAEMDLKSDIPSRIRIKGNPINIFYRGQPRSCFACGEVGHVSKDCPRKQNRNTHPKPQVTPPSENQTVQKSRPAETTSQLPTSSPPSSPSESTKVPATPTYADAVSGASSSLLTVVPSKLVGTSPSAKTAVAVVPRETGSNSEHPPSASQSDSTLLPPEHQANEVKSLPPKAPVDPVIPSSTSTKRAHKQDSDSESDIPPSKRVVSTSVPSNAKSDMVIDPPSAEAESDEDPLKVYEVTSVEQDPTADRVPPPEVDLTEDDGRLPVPGAALSDPPSAAKIPPQAATDNSSVNLPIPGKESEAKTSQEPLKKVVTPLRLDRSVSSPNLQSPQLFTPTPPTPRSKPSAQISQFTQSSTGSLRTARSSLSTKTKGKTVCSKVLHNVPPAQFVRKKTKPSLFSGSSKPR